MIVGAGRRAQRYLTAVEFVLLFTPRLVGKNASVHPAARGIVPLLRSAYPQSAARGSGRLEGGEVYRVTIL